MNQEKNKPNNKQNNEQNSTTESSLYKVKEIKKYQTRAQRKAGLILQLYHLIGATFIISGIYLSNRKLQ